MILKGAQLALRLLTIALILVVVGVFLWGSFVLLGFGLYKYSVAFIGLAMLIATILLFLIWKPTTKTILIFQLIMGLGLFLGLQSFEKTTPFASSTAFEVGSLSVLVTTTFYGKKDSGQFYRELLMISTTSSFLLLFAGILAEVLELTQNTGTTVPISPLYASIVSSFFILGSLDLVILSVYLLRFAMPERIWAALNPSEARPTQEVGERAGAEKPVPPAQDQPVGTGGGSSYRFTLSASTSVLALLLITILVAAGISLYFGLITQSFLTPIVQGSVLAAVVGGIFKIVGDALSSRSRLDQFKLSQIYPEQVKVIKELQRMLVEVETESKAYTSPLQWEGEEGRKKTMAKVGEDGRAVQAYLLKNRIFLRAAVCDKLEKMIEEYFRVWWSWTVDLSYPEGRRLPTSAQVEAELKKIWVELPNLRKQVEDEYREIFGIR